ncbi:hypothetical protein BJF96_g477 [Verticillium dahliae]|uniref:Uncharacterized protein n=1 Tax=Verticillium dahliae TaxID=27337 RepID=A0AA44WT60_VERDA|nr:hypothetical protein BJF96_g477 [Verticillium dahliae]
MQLRTAVFPRAVRVRIHLVLRTVSDHEPFFLLDLELSGPDVKVACYRPNQVEQSASSPLKGTSNKDYRPTLRAIPRCCKDCTCTWVTTGIPTSLCVPVKLSCGPYNKGVHLDAFTQLCLTENRTHYRVVLNFVMASST